MRSRFVCLGMTAGIMLLAPAAAQSGMPSVSITDWAALRFGTLSFFLVVLLVAAAVVRWLWNILAADFPKLPRLTYKRSLAGVVLVGLALAVVLTMIAGSRELLTPGAWEKDGRLYKIASPKEPPTEDPAKQPLSADRKKQLARLNAALTEYAAQHEGKFPDKEAAKEIDPTFWEVPGTSGMRYSYASGLTATDADEILAYEPEFSDGERFVLTAGGNISSMKTENLRRKLRGEE
jgi:hypothetical protein